MTECKFYPSTQGSLNNTRRSLRHTAEKMFPRLKSGRQWKKFRKRLKVEGVNWQEMPSNYFLKSKLTDKPKVSLMDKVKGVFRGAR